MKTKRNKIYFALAGIFIISLIIFFLVPFKYEASLFYDVQEPYTATEYYWDKEPYTVSYRECTKHSWWTGKCTEYNTFYKTEYKNVKKQREIIKYRTIQKERLITAKGTLFELVKGDRQYVFYEVK